jgi:hypothetical protein
MADPDAQVPVMAGRNLPLSMSAPLQPAHSSVADQSGVKRIPSSGLYGVSNARKT